MGLASEQILQFLAQLCGRNLRIRFSGEWLVRLDGESTLERTNYAYLYV